MDYSTSGLSALLQDYGLISLGSTEIFSTSSLSAGTYTYFFAVIISGQLYYDSVEVTVETVEVSAPTGFTASASGSTLTFSWNAVSGAEGYKLYYGYSSGNYVGPLDLGNTTSRTFSGMPDGTYYLAVTAYTGTDESGYSNEESVSISVTSGGNDNFKLPDTGQTGSYTDTFGEDSDYTINPPSYTDNGDGTVTDNNTGLMWQQEDDNNEYTWDDAVGYCEDLSLASHSDWRLPDYYELADIVNYGNYGPAIDGLYFPNTNSSDYWSSTTAVSSPSNVWFVDFDNGDVGDGNKSNGNDVRCVRGGQVTADFSDNGNGTLTDNVTGLAWQQEDDDVQRNWEDAITYCEGLSLAGYSDWRLPNIKELKSIVDISVYPYRNGFRCLS
jgi:hypothetical protein